MDVIFQSRIVPVTRFLVVQLRKKIRVIRG